MQNDFQPEFNRILGIAAAKANPLDPQIVLRDVLNLFKSAEDAEQAGLALTVGCALSFRFGADKFNCQPEINDLLAVVPGYLSQQSNKTDALPTAVSINYARCLVTKSSKLKEIGGENVDNDALLEIFAETAETLKACYSLDIRDLPCALPIVGAPQEFPQAFQKARSDNEYPLVETVQGTFRYLGGAMIPLANLQQNLGKDEEASQNFALAIKVAQEGLEAYETSSSNPTMVVENIRSILTEAVAADQNSSQDALQLARVQCDYILAAVDYFETNGIMQPAKAAEWRTIFNCSKVVSTERLNEDASLFRATALEEAKFFGAHAGKIEDFVRTDASYERAFPGKLFPVLLGAIQYGVDNAAALKAQRRPIAAFAPPGFG